MYFKNEFKIFLKFAIVGLINTTLNYVVFFVSFRILGIYYVLSSLISFFVAFTNSFILNKSWTFKSKKKFAQLPKFFIVNVFSLSINLLVIALSVEIFYLSPLIGQSFGILVSLGINYIGNRYWVFIS